MQNSENEEKSTQTNEPVEKSASKDMQEKSDPQLTELRGFTDPKEDLEPTLQDGTKAPEKDQ